MVEDVVRTLGYTTLGSRLKRIGERLQAQTQELSAEYAGTDLPTPHNPVLAALDRNGPLSVGDMARALGQSQPGVTRMINRMKDEDLVETVADERDRRVSKIALTEKGERLVEQLKTTLWPAIRAAVESACSDLHGPFLDQLAQLEDTLTERPLRERAEISPRRNRAGSGETEEDTQ